MTLRQCIALLTHHPILWVYTGNNKENGGPARPVPSPGIPKTGVEAECYDIDLIDIIMDSVINSTFRYIYIPNGMPYTTI